MKKQILFVSALATAFAAGLLVASCVPESTIDEPPTGGGDTPSGSTIRKVKNVKKVYSIKIADDLAKTSNATVTYIDATNKVKTATINGTTWSYEGPKSNMNNTDMGISVAFEPGSVSSSQYYDIGYSMNLDYQVTYTDGSTELVNAVQANPLTEDVKGQYINQALDAASMGTMVYIAIADSSKLTNLPKSNYPSEFASQAYQSNYDGVEEQASPTQMLDLDNRDDEEYIDLDLASGLRWCSHNVGATSPSDLGGLYGWGDATGFQIDPNPYYYYTNSPTLESISGTRYDICQTMDCTSRMPTREEWNEMLDGTTAQMGECDGQYGQWRISKKNSTHRIFLPESGTRRGNYTSRGSSAENWYWTASLYTSDRQAAYAMRFTHSGNTYKPGFHERFYGAAVRAVKSASAATMTTPNTLGSTPTTPTTPPAVSNEMKAIDMGLSVEWANMNWGAKTMYDAGNYYAWGEMATKSEYSSTNYAWPVTLTWFSGIPYETIPLRSHYINNSWTYDVVYKESNGQWAMPSYWQMKELVDACNPTWYNWGNPEFKGTAGCKLARKDNPSVYIFLPATGYYADKTLQSPNTVVYLWTGTVCEDKHQCYSDAYNLYADEDQTDNDKPRANVWAYMRYMGLAIRPVKAAPMIN